MLSSSCFPASKGWQVSVFPVWIILPLATPLFPSEAIRKCPVWFLKYRNDLLTLDMGKRVLTCFPQFTQNEVILPVWSPGRTVFLLAILKEVSKNCTLVVCGVAGLLWWALKYYSKWHISVEEEPWFCKPVPTIYLMDGYGVCVHFFFFFKCFRDKLKSKKSNWYT